MASSLRVCAAAAGLLVESFLRSRAPRASRLLESRATVRDRLITDRFAGFCSRAGGSHPVHKTAALVRGGGIPDNGAAGSELSALGFGAIQSLANAGRPFDVALPAAFGAAFARAVALVVAEATLPALASHLFGPPRSSGGGRTSAAGSIAHLLVPRADQVLPVLQDGGLRVYDANGAAPWPRPALGRAGYTDPFLGRVCGKPVWIRQSATLGLPNEILFSIFSYAVGNYADADPARRIYYQRLFSIASACQHWNDYVGSCGGLWSTFRLTPHRLAASLSFWLSRIHRAPVDLRLSFDDMFALYHPRSTARAPRLGTRDSILRVSPAFSQCARLSIDADATYAFPLLMELLCVASGHLLVSLSITRVYFAFLEDRVPPIDPTPNLFFRSGVPRLRFLRLCNALVGWGNLEFYGRLEVFTVWAMRPPVNPTADQLYAILVVARFLVRLSMREVECDSLSPRVHPLFYLPSLVELDLHLSGTLGVPDVLARCRMPALRTLTLILDSEFDLRCILACSAMLERVVVLSLQVTGLSMPLVEHLDVSRSSAVAFSALHSPDGPYYTSNLCPRLSRLVVRNVPPSDMKDFLRRRAASGLVLHQLTMFQVVDFFESNETDLAWIAGTLGADAFHMDPEGGPSPSADWLLH
ncbi:hypothetical protein B0H16DRAFT_1742206 [Mycena metata]|uniref:F-box domain-containing protein n=1 Tax=Mycena metata TaxID=1033252 RepID=A0AAD7MFP6_9AGAR|nr:hypothetical protein B0H16DRAFT_1742206 [Mycena metata]